MSAVRHALLTITSDSGLPDALRGLLDADQPIAVAGSPREGIAQARAGGPALILLDAALPGLDVREFCLELKADPRTSGIPVVLAAPSESAAAGALEQGANDCLAYPFHPVVAKARLRNYVNLGRCVDVLRRYSLVDAVTGIANRRRFDEFMTLEWRRNQRSHTPLSIVLMDLDHFRAYVERYGPRAGDEALKRIATAFNEATQRPGDLLACYSRSGFACVLPETDTLGAVSVAERMRAELATLAIPHEDSATASILTMSVGAVTRVPDVKGEPEELIALAERTLGEAKRTGRDRVMFAS